MTEKFYFVSALPQNASNRDRELQRSSALQHAATISHSKKKDGARANFWSPPRSSQPPLYAQHDGALGSQQWLCKADKREHLPGRETDHAKTSRRHTIPHMTAPGSAAAESIQHSPSPQRLNVPTIGLRHKRYRKHTSPRHGSSKSSSNPVL